MKLPFSHTLETPRCRLRFPTLEDVPHIFSATRYPGFNDGMTWDPPEDDAPLVAHHEETVQEWEQGSRFCFTIEEQASGAFVGRIDIRRKEGTLWDIGYWTHPERQGRGYMTEAAAAIVRFGFCELGATTITACHALWNRASRRVLERVGMRFLEHVPQGFQKNGRWVEEDRLAITRSQWEANQAAGA